MQHLTKQFSVVDSRITQFMQFASTNKKALVFVILSGIVLPLINVVITLTGFSMDSGLCPDTNMLYCALNVWILSVLGVNVVAILLHFGLTNFVVMRYAEGSTGASLMLFVNWFLLLLVGIFIPLTTATVYLIAANCGDTCPGHSFLGFVYMFFSAVVSGGTTAFRFCSFPTGISNEEQIIDEEEERLLVSTDDVEQF